MGSIEEPKINLVRIAHVYYTHKDIGEARQFLVDFGFKECKRVGNKTYYRGYSREPFVYCAIEGDEPSFGGAAFVVQSEEDLERASRTIPGASAIYELTDAPGGGRCVTFQDPVDKFPFHLIYGQKLRDQETVLPELEFNFVSYLLCARGMPNVFMQPVHKHREGGKYQRFEKREWSMPFECLAMTNFCHQGPAPVHRLGHFGMCVTDFDKTFDFYTRRFNLYPSDVCVPCLRKISIMCGVVRDLLTHLQIGHTPEGKNVIVFNRLARGKELVDHHTFFFFEGPKSHVHHSSFETHDFDTQVLGHDWLRHKGYENCWGVGRHVMGSQIFDYWSVNEPFFGYYICSNLALTFVVQVRHIQVYRRTLR